MSTLLHFAEIADLVLHQCEQFDLAGPSSDQDGVETVLDAIVFDLVSIHLEQTLSSHRPDIYYSICTAARTHNIVLILRHVKTARLALEDVPRKLGDLFKVHSPLSFELVIGDCPVEG